MDCSYDIQLGYIEENTIAEMPEFIVTAFYVLA